MDHLETVFADAIIHCTVSPTTGDLVIAESEVNQVIEKLRKDSLAAAEDVRTVKRQMTETLSTVDQNMRKLSGKVLELESVLSLVRMEAEMKLKDMSSHISTFNSAMTHIEAACKASATTNNAELSAFIAQANQTFETVLNLQRNAVSLPTESADLFTTVNTLSNSLNTVKKKATMRIRKLTDENTDLEERNQQLQIALQEATVKLLAAKEEVKTLGAIHEEQRKLYGNNGSLNNGGDNKTDNTGNSSNHNNNNPNGSSKSTQMQICLLQEECATLRSTSHEKQREYETKIETLHSALVQAAKEHEHDRRQWKQEVTELQSRLQGQGSSPTAPSQQPSVLSSTEVSEAHASQLASLEKQVTQLLIQQQQQQQRMEKQRHEDEEVSRKYQALEQRHSQLQIECTTQLEEIQSLTASLQYTKDSLRLSEESLKNLRLQLRNKEKQYQEAMTALSQLQLEYDTYKNETLAQQKTFQELTTMKIPWLEKQVQHEKDVVTMKDEKIQQLQAAIQEREDRLFRLSVEQDRSQQNILQLQEDLYSKQFEIDRWKSQVQQGNEQLQKQEVALKEVQTTHENEHASMRSLLREKEQTIAQLQDDIVLIQRQTHELMEEFRNEIHHLQSLMNQKDQEIIDYQQKMSKAQDFRDKEWSQKYSLLEEEFQKSQKELKRCRLQCQRQESEMNTAVGRFQEELMTLQLQMAEINSLSFDFDNNNNGNEGDDNT